MKRIILLAALAAGMFAFTLTAQTFGSAIYWTSGGSILRADLDGRDAQVVYQGFVEDGLALDLKEKMMYFSGNLPLGAPGPTGRIWRTDLDGQGLQTLVSSYPIPAEIALQPPKGNFAAAKMYWADGQSIQRADLDGARQETLVDKLSSAYGVALDVDAGKVYWTRNEADERVAAVRRANLDGSAVEDLIVKLPGPTTGIALDLKAGKMYWGFVDPRIDGLLAGFILRSNLDGSDMQTVTGGLHSPCGIALDTEAGKLYWTDRSPLPGAGTIWRADLDGSNREPLVPGQLSPGAIALDLTVVPEPAFIGIALMGAGLFLRRRDQ